ncbi:hypothetical protein [Litoreibacter arenae]|nr:hypothetical protein [Litoreibacter arenae]
MQDPVLSSSVATSDAPSPTSDQVNKARMLVSMLGADFAKSSKHPFFKDLARKAVCPVERTPASQDMSKALANLVSQLAKPQTHRSTARKISVPAPANAGTPTQSRAEQSDEIMAQHPALIAKHLVKLTTPQQLDALRKLRGQTARQVAAYLAELKK